jgi:hypothetical protein
MNPHPELATPLQQALLEAAQRGGAQALWQAHADRLALLCRQCSQQIDAGLAPADFSAMHQRLAACEAALRVLHTLRPVSPGPPLPGPALGLLQPLTHP